MIFSAPFCACSTILLLNKQYLFFHHDTAWYWCRQSDDVESRMFRLVERKCACVQNYFIHVPEMNWSLKFATTKLQNSDFLFSDEMILFLFFGQNV